jgi:pyridoxal phosphate enzyme (YggS family)
VSIAENIAKLRAGLPEGVTLVAVSKTRPPEAILEAYAAGQRVFGENRPQEMAAKQAALATLTGSETSAGSGTSAALGGPPAGIEWHQIGHLQTNKVRLVAPFVSLIHSADSARLLRTVSREAVALGRTIDVLLEIRIAREESKEGWEWRELLAWLSTGEWRELSGVRFRGVIGVATFTDDEAVVRGEFESLARMHATLRERFFGGEDDTTIGDPVGTGFDTISMGMSDDYPLALECGSTMVRIGSAIFGPRA